MQVSIVTFPRTRVAVLTHVGPPADEYETVRKLIAWKLRHGLLDPVRYRHYGLHYTDPRTVDPREHRVDFCLSIDFAIGSNAEGIREHTIPALRCALARDVGSRADNQAARHLWERWLPASGEAFAGPPVIFHYVNVGPQVRPDEAITDVYLPLA